MTHEEQEHRTLHPDSVSDVRVEPLVGEEAFVDYGVNALFLGHDLGDLEVHGHAGQNVGVVRGEALRP